MGHPVQALCAFFATASTVTAVTMLRDPCAGFNLFGVRLADLASVDPGSDTALVVTLYACSVAGEGVLQLAAAIWPQLYLRAVICFMFSYKLVSIAALLLLGARQPRKGQRRQAETKALAVQWGSPLLLFLLVGAFSSEPFPYG